MAATAKHAGKMARVKLFIEVLPVVFYGPFVINPPWRALFRHQHREINEPGGSMPRYGPLPAKPG
jgi:hypothetical protein